MKILEMCAAERPREKALALGAGALSNAELLAVILRTGCGNDSAVDLGHKLLAMSGGSLVRLKDLGVDDFCTIPGIKENKAAGIAAAIELGRRFCAEEASSLQEPIVASGEIYRILIPYMKGLHQEECRIVLLNRAQFFIKTLLMTTGGAGATIIDVQAIVRAALENRAAFVILSHNHPSGDPRPSKADIKYTKSLREALSTMDVGLLDHVIVCDDCFYSFADERVWTSPF